MQHIAVSLVNAVPVLFMLVCALALIYAMQGPKWQRSVSRNALFLFGILLIGLVNAMADTNIDAVVESATATWATVQALIVAIVGFFIAIRIVKWIVRR